MAFCYSSLNRSGKLPSIHSSITASRGVGMTQWLTVLADLPEDRSWVTSAHFEQSQLPVTPASGNLMPSCGLRGACTHVAQALPYP